MNKSIVTRAQFEALILAADSQIKGYLVSSSPIVTIDPDTGSYIYRFDWVGSGDGAVRIIFSDVHGDATQWDTDIESGGSDSWSPFDTAVAAMYAVMVAEKLHQKAFPDSLLFTDNGSIL